MPSPYRVCVVGMTFGLAHARAWRRLEPRVQLVAIAEMDEAKRRKLLASPDNEILKGHLPLSLYEDAVDMMDREKPDIISIAVRPALNPQFVLAAAKRGIHVVCEKPMATTLEDADKMIEVCRETGVKLSVGHQRRSAIHPYSRARRMLDEGCIGKLTHLTGYWPQVVPEDRGWELIEGYGGGNIMFLGTHIFDLFRYYAGDPLWVSADLERVVPGPGPETGARIWFGFPNDVSAYYEGDANQGVTFDRRQGEVVCLYGEEGGIHMPAQGRRLFLRTKNSPEWQEVPYNTSTEEVREVGVRAAREAFLDWIEEKPANVATDRDGRFALEMALAAYESNRLGGIRLTFPARIQGNPLVRTLDECPGALLGRM